MAAPKDYYKVLGVQDDAKKTEIKKVFRKLAREFHPDQNQDKPGAEERFKEIQEAYETLSDDVKRKKYDRMRKNPFQGDIGGMYTSPGGGQFYQAPDGTFVRMDRSGAPRGMEGEGAFGGIGDIFSQFFGGPESGPARPGPEGPSGRSGERKSDTRRTVRLSFRRMLAGGKVKIALDGQKIQVPFPKGVRDGFKVRIRGKGRVGRDGRPGDLYVTFKVSKHRDFQRDGNDIHSSVTVTAMEAILGVDRSIGTPDGKKIKLRLPAGVQPGEVLRVKGHGIAAEKATGNLLVHVSVEMPTNLTEEQKELLRSAAKEAGIK